MVLASGPCKTISINSAVGTADGRLKLTLPGSYPPSVDRVARIWEKPAEPEACLVIGHSRGHLRIAWVSSSDSTIVWLARSRPTKLGRKQAQRHSTNERAEGANEQPVAPEPAAALVVRDGDTCFHRQN